MTLNVFKFKNLIVICSILLAITVYACSGMKPSSNKKVHASISSTKASVPGSGTISFEQEGAVVEMKLEINFPSKANKSVAVHLHEHGDCGNEGVDAHGHWNPAKSSHGKWGSAQFHLGDIGNIQLDAAGKGSLELKTDKWTIGTGATNDVTGVAVIVHDGIDDYVTQPTGNAGSRIGCGVISK